LPRWVASATAARRASWLLEVRRSRRMAVFLRRYFRAHSKVSPVSGGSTPAARAAAARITRIGRAAVEEGRRLDAAETDGDEPLQHRVELIAAGVRVGPAAALERVEHQGLSRHVQRQAVGTAGAQHAGLVLHLAGLAEHHPV